MGWVDEEKEDQPQCEANVRLIDHIKATLHWPYAIRSIADLCLSLHGDCGHDVCNYISNKGNISRQISYVPNHPLFKFCAVTNMHHRPLQTYHIIYIN